jgi:ABC-type uncharacterized transport system ATPase subunit
MSTHQMHQVEEMCERILLVNHGRVMLYGALEEIRRQFSGHALSVRAPGGLPELPGVLRVERVNGAYRLALAAETTPQQVLRALVEREVPVERFEVAVPTLDEIFIRVVSAGAGRENPPGGAGQENPPGGAGQENPPGGAGQENPPGGAQDAPPAGSQGRDA